MPAPAVRGETPRCTEIGGAPAEPCSSVGATLVVALFVTRNNAHQQNSAGKAEFRGGSAEFRVKPQNSAGEAQNSAWKAEFSVKPQNSAGIDCSGAFATGCQRVRIAGTVSGRRGVRRVRTESVVRLPRLSPSYGPTTHHTPLRSGTGAPRNVRLLHPGLLSALSNVAGPGGPCSRGCRPAYRSRCRILKNAIPRNRAAYARAVTASTSKSRNSISSLPYAARLAFSLASNSG